jgi:DNA-binding transcriptional regulator YhcF (GntR family)
MARFIRIDLNSPIPATRQIADALRVELVEGRLKPGDELPSVRRAAIDLGLHFNTVAEAYRQLAAEGWLDLKHGRGARVADRKKPTAASRETVADYRQRLRELISHMRANGVSAQRIAEELRALAEGVQP